MPCDRALNPIDLGGSYIKTKFEPVNVQYNLSKPVTVASSVKFQHQSLKCAKKVPNEKVHFLGSTYMGKFSNLIQIFNN